MNSYPGNSRSISMALPDCAPRESSNIANKRAVGLFDPFSSRKAGVRPGSSPGQAFAGKRYPEPIEFDENRLRFAKPIFFIPNFRHGP
jgi:hypothetical protein